jgi:hypothetical protein
VIINGYKEKGCQKTSKEERKEISCWLDW